MTKVTVQSGACGFAVVVTAEKGKDKKIRISVLTDCEMVRKMAAEIAELDMMAAFTGFQGNPVYRSAARHLRHVACPVPGGVLKALEVEAGLCLPRNVLIEFEKKP